MGSSFRLKKRETYIKALTILTIQLLMVLPSAGQSIGTRKALVIGNATYDSLKRVPSAKDDAIAVASSLRALQFVVTEKPDLTASALVVVILEFNKSLQPSDLALLYYSGYAVQDQSEDILLPVDFRPNKNDLDRGYSVTRLDSEWVEKRTSARIIILDACRDNPDLAQALSPNYQPGLTVPELEKSTLVVLSAQQNRTVPDDPKLSHLFAQDLVKILATKGLTADEVFRHLVESVNGDSNNAQYPFKSGDVPSFPLTGDPPPPEPPAGEIRQNRNGQFYVRIPRGKFDMGCVPGDKACLDHENPRHPVEITHGFWMGEATVTVRDWSDYLSKTKADGKRNIKKLMPRAPLDNQGWKKTDRPMVNISWAAAKSYCTWAGGRLPSEAEWEYAARAGKDGDKSFPQKARNPIYSRDEMPASKAFSANAFKLYDMGGLVWEWTADLYDRNYYRDSPDTDPMGPNKGSSKNEHTSRGGSYAAKPDELRISQRNPRDKFDNITGFRCVIENLPQ